ncbi:MAG: 16S rRNA (uracil(1498)-N(3))-methyltransferase [Caldilineaceae bacterium]|nr:16S rRNA (uracil(1498)-N(3))-methyltransferase [Caldilineaceae bacterium]
MHRFFLTQPALILHQPVDLAPLAHQLRTVLRLQPGEQILLLDGQGYAYLTEIRQLERGHAVGQILDREFVAAEPRTHLTLYQCALKTDKFEWVLQKGTEIGVARFVPVISSRTIVRPAEKIRKKAARWQTIICEAAEQSGRGRLPALADPLLWDEAVKADAGLRLLLWEGTLTSAAPAALADIFTDPNDDVSLLIGPEGGISQDEADLATATGWRTISLGPRILRAETAALVAAALVLHYQER